MLGYRSSEAPLAFVFPPGPGDQVESLALVANCLGMPYWHYQSSSARVTSVKSAKSLSLTQLERTGPIDRTPGTPGSDKNGLSHYPTKRLS